MKKPNAKVAHAPIGQAARDESNRSMKAPETDKGLDGGKSLETRKLQLEIAKLQGDLKSGTRFEIVKAIGAFLTSLGIIGTLWLGINQQKQTRISRDDERFERSVSRLGSVRVSERLTGLAGIQQFLQGPDRTRQLDALNYLVNAGVIESDPTARSAIQNVFDSLSKMKLDSNVLNAGLSAARDRNRAVLSRATDAFWKKQTDAKKRLVDESFTEVPIGNPSPEEMAPLEISAKMIAGLIRAGARIDDLSSIYCVNCNFSSLQNPAKLAGVNFDGAFLRRSDFSGSDLRAASFHNADLILTNFLGANLSKAKITADTQLEQWSVSAAQYSGELASSWGAVFACSDLSYADFTGRTIFSLIYRNSTYGGNMRDEFYNANLLGANFKAMNFIVATPSDPFSDIHNNTEIMGLPAAFSPMNSNGFTKITGAIHYFKQTNYFLWQYEGGQNDQFNAIPNPYGQDLVTFFSELTNARNLDKAELPSYVRIFLDANKDALKTPFISYDCSTGQKKADISGMFAQGNTNTGNARF